MATIFGAGHYLPSQIVTNNDLCRFMETSDEWIVTRSGIRERRWLRRGFESQPATASDAEPASNAGMAAEAIRRALAAAEIEVGALDAVFYATITADQEIPGSGSLVQAALGAGRPLPVVEIRNQCSGFLFALQLARAYVQRGTYKTVAVVGCEIQSSGLDLSTRGRNTAVLFADGAGAVILRADSSHDGRARPAGVLIDLALHSDGRYADKLGVVAPGFARRCVVDSGDFDGEEPEIFPRMDGKFVFKVASEKMPEVIRELLDRQGLSLDDLSLVVPHQANQRILDMLAQQLGLGDRVYSNIACYGNTTAASIPIALSEVWAAGRLTPGALVALASFGSGFSWAGALIRF